MGTRLLGRLHHPAHVGHAPAGSARRLLLRRLGDDRLGSQDVLIVGETAFATWEEAELLEVSMVAHHGPADARRLGVEPASMRAVLQGSS